MGKFSGDKRPEEEANNFILTLSLLREFAFKAGLSSMDILLSIGQALRGSYRTEQDG